VLDNVNEFVEEQPAVNASCEAAVSTKVIAAMRSKSGNEAASMPILMSYP
jgi:hypothetical protein